MAKFYCLIHGYCEAKAADCSFCKEAEKAAREYQRVLELFRPTPGVCGFCGGPTPCLRED